MVTMTAKDLLRKSIMASPYITTLIDGKLDIVPTTVSNKIRRGVFLGHNRSTKILTEYNSSNLSITRVRMIPVDDSIDDESITVESFEQNPNVIDCGTFNQEQ